MISKMGFVSAAVLVAATMSVPSAHAEDVSAKKLQIKDNVKKPDKRQVQVQSKDAGVELIEADDPASNGASLHLYSATDDICVVLPAGPDWQDKGKFWKYKSKATKNQAQVGDGKLKVKIKSGVTFTLADDGSQGTVNAQVQFGNGTRYCMRCSGNKKDDAKQFQGKDCVAAPCDVEPSVCDPTVTTTTTTSSTTTTTMTPPGDVLQGVLPPTTGRFNYGLGIGLPGSDAACNDLFPGSHTCSYSELQAAAAAGDLVGRKDINGGTITSFWAIDAARPATSQCTVTIDWDYATAHTGQFGDIINVDTGTGSLTTFQANTLCLTGTRHVGCCN